jgi:tetratricopeptide (TPR) repeat protein
MAPEQYDGADVDARADVFSFCASLFEALHGKRPFAGTTAAQVQRARLEGSVEPPPDDAAIPRWLHDAVMAGLVPQIDRRPASMDAMLELLREPRRGRRWWWAAAVGMATAGVAVAVAVWPNAQASAPGCGGDDPLETLWDDGRRARLAGLGHIGWPGAEQRIDAYVADWRAAWAEVCTEPSGEAVSPEAELQRACLRARLPQFDAELLALEDGRVPVQEVLRRLAEPRSCMQEPGTALLPVPSELQMRERVEQLREQIVYLQAEQRAGRMSEISEKIGTVLASAREIGFRPVLAESLYLAGTNEAFVGQPQRAHPLLFEAANHATASGHDTIAAEAWLFLVNVSAADLGDVRRGHEYASQAWAALDRLGEAPIRREIELRLRLNEAELLLTDSNYPAMHEQIDQAEVLARDHDPDALDRVWELRALAYQSTDRVQEAVASHRRVLALRQERMGRLHPNTFVAMLNLSGALVEGGSRKEGLAYANAAVAAASDVFPADSLMLAELRINLAEAWRGVGKPEQSLEVASQARQALGVVDDTNERLSAYIELVVGAALTDLGRDEESVVATRRALETASHIDARGTLSAFARVHLVESLRVTGNLVEAERVGREAVAFEVAREPSDPWMLAMAEHVLGAVLLDTGDVAEAERRLTVAVDSLTSRETDRDMRVPAMASLARARWLLGDRTSATELARQAWEMLVRDPSGGRERAALEDWARSHKVNLEE